MEINSLGDYADAFQDADKKLIKFYYLGFEDSTDMALKQLNDLREILDTMEEFIIDG